MIFENTFGNYLFKMNLTMTGRSSMHTTDNVFKIDVRISDVTWFKTVRINEKFG